MLAVYDQQFLKEQNIFGTSRLGTYKTTQKTKGERQVGDAEEAGKVIFGNRTYEMSNHLGNVMATVSDRVKKENGAFDAVVISAQDYYPFGAVLPGRVYSKKDYRFGFQGQEEDQETEFVNYKYRMHNPRIGRFFSVDPLAPKYPHNSPYAFSENVVINAVELEGLEYKSAGKWANDNLTGWKTDWGNEETYKRTYWGFSHHRSESYQAKIKKTDALQCIESCHFAYANGNGKVYDYLKNTGYFKGGVSGSHSRKSTFEYFNKGGENHSLISANDATSADVGDMIFYKNNSANEGKNPWKQNAGHKTIMGSKPTINEDGQLTYSEYSINADGEKYGERTVTFDKNEDGNWMKTGSDYEIQGFGRVDEEAITTESE